MTHIPHNQKLRTISLQKNCLPEVKAVCITGIPVILIHFPLISPKYFIFFFNTKNKPKKNFNYSPHYVKKSCAPWYQQQGRTAFLFSNKATQKSLAANTFFVHMTQLCKCLRRTQMQYPSLPSPPPPPKKRGSPLHLSLSFRLTFFI